jgi:hypothetical protein
LEQLGLRGGRAVEDRRDHEKQQVNPDAGDSDGRKTEQRRPCDGNSVSIHVYTLPRHRSGSQARALASTVDILRDAPHLLRAKMADATMDFQKSVPPRLAENRSQ